MTDHKDFYPEATVENAKKKLTLLLSKLKHGEHSAAQFLKKECWTKKQNN